MTVVQQVVGAAIVRERRVLAARRTQPSVEAGRWEFPGGKVEAEESPEQALVREIAEELGVAVVVTGWLAETTPIGTSYVLAIALAELVTGDPAPSEHDEIRWLSADQLGEVDWLEPDRPFLAELREILQA